MSDTDFINNALQCHHLKCLKSRLKQSTIKVHCNCNKD